MCGAQADNVYVCMYVHDWLFCGLHSPWTRVPVRPCRHALSCLNLYVRHMCLQLELGWVMCVDL